MPMSPTPAVARFGSTFQLLYGGRPLNPNSATWMQFMRHMGYGMWGEDTGHVTVADEADADLSLQAERFTPPLKAVKLDKRA